ncbi:hypothetical protein ACFX13_014663 [Malus domestica]|uniref:Uncharacterized protein n=1 Tax=Malus domestica TaxID=3750 RepID=A0A498HYQ6_MALDO|nr:hypothetical protein DVH24_019636 [Malus domestica]
MTRSWLIEPYVDNLGKENVAPLLHSLPLQISSFPVEAPQFLERHGVEGMVSAVAEESGRFLIGQHHEGKKLVVVVR